VNLCVVFVAAVNNCLSFELALSSVHPIHVCFSLHLSNLTDGQRPIAVQLVPERCSPPFQLPSQHILRYREDLIRVVKFNHGFNFERIEFGGKEHIGPTPPLTSFPESSLLLGMWTLVKVRVIL
jgi:hypothetical protein